MDSIANVRTLAMKKSIGRKGRKYIGDYSRSLTCSSQRRKRLSMTMAQNRSSRLLTALSAVPL
jgi:hypothetical protein